MLKHVAQRLLPRKRLLAHRLFSSAAESLSAGVPPWSPARDAAEYRKKELRLMRRIANAEGALGLNDWDGTASLGPAATNSTIAKSSTTPSSVGESLEERSARLFRLYLELGRPGHRSNSEETSIDTAQLLTRVQRLWTHLEDSGNWAATHDAPLALQAARAEAVAGLARPMGSRSTLEAELEAFQRAEWKTNTSGDQTSAEHLESLHAALVAGAARCLGVERGCMVLDMAPVARPDAMLSRLARHLGAGQVAFDVFVTCARHLGVVPTPSHFAAWVRPLTRGSSPLASALEGLKACPALDGHPEVDSALLLAAARDKGPQAESQALKTLEAFKASQQPPSMDALNAAVEWCSAMPPSKSRYRFGPGHALACSVEDVMVTCNVEPTARLLTGMLQAYAVAGDAPRVLGVWHTAKALNIPLRRDAYFVVFNALRTASVQSPAAWDLVADPSKVLNGLIGDLHAHSGITLDSSLFSAALHVYLSSLRSWKILSQNQASMSRELPDPLHVASEALDLVRSASEGMKGHPPLATDPLVTHMLLRVLVSVQQIDRAVVLIDDMRSLGLSLDADAYNIIINKVAQKDLSAAEDLVVQMTNVQILPNEKTMDYFLRGYTSEGQPETGISMIQSCFNMYQVRPSRKIFMGSVKKFHKARQTHEVQRAAYIFEQMWPEEKDYFWDTVSSWNTWRSQEMVED